MKQATWLCAGIGSVVGGFIPALWGAGTFSFSSIIFSSLGAMAGIFVAYKLTH
jgi:uncharacterized membrane protein YeaQ/YmgE (transglycosylase-associated protein family)